MQIWTDVGKRFILVYKVSAKMFFNFLKTLYFKVEFWKKAYLSEYNFFLSYTMIVPLEHAT